MYISFFKKNAATDAFFSSRLSWSFGLGWVGVVLYGAAAILFWMQGKKMQEAI